MTKLQWIPEGDICRFISPNSAPQVTSPLIPNWLAGPALIQRVLAVRNTPRDKASEFRTRTCGPPTRT
jgi:hypothetical protein